MSTTKRKLAKRGKSGVPAGYTAVLADVKRLIAESRHRALATVNRELVALYWQIGHIIVQQQQTANWGDAVVEQLSQDLRLAFPDFAGLTSDNMWRMRKFYISCHDIDRWLSGNTIAPTMLAAHSPAGKLGTVCPEKPSRKHDHLATSTLPPPDREIVGTLSPQVRNAELKRVIESLSWSHHRMILGVSERPDERYFYLTMTVRERWSVRALRRQIDSALFLRYMSVKRDPEKCLPDDAESGDLLPFKDHCVLECRRLPQVRDTAQSPREYSRESLGAYPPRRCSPEGQEQRRCSHLRQTVQRRCASAYQVTPCEPVTAGSRLESQGQPEIDIREKDHLRPSVPPRGLLLDDTSLAALTGRAATVRVSSDHLTISASPTCNTKALPAELGSALP